MNGFLPLILQIKRCALKISQEIPDIGNKYSPTVIVAAITAKISKAKLPTHVEIKKEAVGLSRDSVILLEQIRTIDKIRLEDKIGELDSEMMDVVNTCLGVSIGFNN